MSFKFNVTTTPIRFVVPDSTRIKTNQIYLEENVNQIRARTDAEGRSFPDGVDLIETGAFLASGFANASGYGFGVGYASYLTKYKYAGLSEPYKQRADARISELWKTEPLAIEDKAKE